MNHLHLKPPSRSALLLVLPALVGSVALAQTDTPPAAPAGEIVQLSPFSVTSENDSAYRAANAISGTRTNTPIKDIPLNIQVFTPEMGDDILARSQLDFERYNASLVNGNADVHSSNAIQQSYNAFLFRGFRQNWGLRDGVRAYDPIDYIGIERIELVKGPSAPLYGLTYAGGVMNNISKQAVFGRNATQLDFTLQSEGEYRSALDANYSTDKVAARINAAYTKSEDWRAHSEGKIEYTQALFGWKPFAGTEIRFQSEQGFREKPNGLGYFATSENNPLTNTPYSNNSWVPLQVTHPNIPYSWNWAVGNNRTSETSLNRITISQEIIKDLNIFAYWQANSRQQIDSQGWDNGSANGGGSSASWDVGPTWRPYATFNSGWINPNIPNSTNTINPSAEYIRLAYHYRDWNNTMHAYGSMVSYKFDVADAVRNTLTAGFNVWSERFTTRMGTLPTGTTSFVDFLVRPDIALPTPYGPPADFFFDRNGAFGRENNSNDNYFANWQVSAIDNRLKVNAGANRTNLKLINLGSGSATTAQVTEASKTSPMVGAMFDVVKNVSVFATYSTSLFPTTDKNDFDVTLPPDIGKGKEIGVKFDLIEGKLTGTVSYYIIEKQGGAQRDENAINRGRAQWDSLTPAQRLTTFPTSITTDGITGRNLIRDRSGNLGDLVPGEEQESKGFEIDLVYSPIKNWNILFSFAHNNVEISDSLTASNIGKQPIDGTIKTQYSVLTKYSFTEGAVSGLSLGLGFNGQGKTFRDYSGPGPNGSARYSPTSLWAEIFATYKYKAFGYNQSVQLNVKNLTEQEEFFGWRATGSNAISTKQYELPTKRVISLSYGIDF